MLYFETLPGDQTLEWNVRPKWPEQNHLMSQLKPEVHMKRIWNVETTSPNPQTLKHLREKNFIFNSWTK